MAIRERLSGNEAVATAMKQINPDVVAAYPITPSTEIPQYFSNFVAMVLLILSLYLLKVSIQQCLLQLVLQLLVAEL